MGCKVVVVASREVSREVDFVYSIYPFSEVWVFSEFENSFDMDDCCVSCFDRVKLVGVDHERRVVSLRALDSRDFFMVSYDVLFVFCDISGLENLKKEESA